MKNFKDEIQAKIRLESLKNKIMALSMTASHCADIPRDDFIFGIEKIIHSIVESAKESFEGTEPLKQLVAFIDDMPFKKINRRYKSLMKLRSKLCEVIESRNKSDDRVSLERIDLNLGAKDAGQNRRLPKDVMRINRNLTRPYDISKEAHAAVDKIKGMGNDFYNFLSEYCCEGTHESTDFKDIAIAQERIEEAVMWAVKGVTK